MYQKAKFRKFLSFVLVFSLIIAVFPLTGFHQNKVEAWGLDNNVYRYTQGDIAAYDLEDGYDDLNAIIMGGGAGWAANFPNRVADNGETFGSPPKVIYLGAGNYKLTDHLIMRDREVQQPGQASRLVLRAAPGTKPEDVIIDGGQEVTFTEQTDGGGGTGTEREIDNRGYGILMNDSASMIEGMTITHMGELVASEKDLTGTGSITKKQTQYSILMQGGTINRCIIEDNSPIFPLPMDAPYGFAPPSLITFDSGTLTGCLVAHNSVYVNYFGDYYTFTYDNTQNGSSRTMSFILNFSGVSSAVGNTFVNNKQGVLLTGDYSTENNVWVANTHTSGLYWNGDYTSSCALLKVCCVSIAGGTDYRPLYNFFDSDDLQRNSTRKITTSDLYYESGYYAWGFVETTGVAAGMDAKLVTDDGDVGIDGLFVNMDNTVGAWTIRDVAKPEYDYHPAAGSKLINKGTDLYFPEIPYDLTANEGHADAVKHFYGAAPDLGCYEYTTGQTEKTWSNEGYGDAFYITEKGSGSKNGKSWNNAYDGRLGVQNGVMFARRLGIQDIFTAVGDYEIKGRLLLYTQPNHNLTSGIWGGIVLAPHWGSPDADPQNKVDYETYPGSIEKISKDPDYTQTGQNIYGGFAGNETGTKAQMLSAREHFTQDDNGVKLYGNSQNKKMSHFIGKKTMASRVIPDPTKKRGETGAANGSDYVDADTAYTSLENLFDKKLFDEELPKFPKNFKGEDIYGMSAAYPTTTTSMGVRVLANVDPYNMQVDGIEISGGFCAYLPKNHTAGIHAALANQLGGAGARVWSGTIKNCYLHENYEAVANFLMPAATCGGGALLEGNAVMDSCVVTRNAAETSGGGLLVNNASKLLNSYVAHNIAMESGGGVATGTVHSSSFGDVVVANIAE